MVVDASPKQIHITTDKLRNSLHRFKRGVNNRRLKRRLMHQDDVMVCGALLRGCFGKESLGSLCFPCSLCSPLHRVAEPTNVRTKPNIPTPSGIQPLSDTSSQRIGQDQHVLGISPFVYVQIHMLMGDIQYLILACVKHSWYLCSFCETQKAHVFVVCLC